MEKRREINQISISVVILVNLPHLLCVMYYYDITIICYLENGQKIEMADPEIN